MMIFFSEVVRVSVAVRAIQFHYPDAGPRSSGTGGTAESPQVLATARRPEMSAHSAQTSSGIRPARIISAKALQPRQ